MKTVLSSVGTGLARTAVARKAAHRRAAARTSDHYPDDEDVRPMRRPSEVGPVTQAELARFDNATLAKGTLDTRRSHFKKVTELLRLDFLVTARLVTKRFG